MAEQNTAFKGPVVAIVIVGVAAAVLAGIGTGFDPTAIVILVFIALAGWLGVSVARRSSSGTVGPRQCAECGGLNAASAPYCKHCGTQFEVA